VVSVPLYLALAALLFVGAPVWLLATAAADVVRGPARVWARTRALGFFGLYLGCEVAGVVVATLLWAATLGGRIGGPERYLEANVALQRWWSGTLFNGSVWLFSLKLQVEGLELARSGPFLLFVRHASTADTVLAAAFVANPNRLLLRYVLKRGLLWDPCLDIVGRRLPNAFVDRTGSHGRAEVDAVAQLAKDLDARSGVLIYPEGTRSRDGKLQTLKKGGFFIALRARLPIVPVRVSGSHDIVPSGSLAVRPGHVVVELFDPIPTAGKTDADIPGLMAKVRDVLLS